MTTERSKAPCEEFDADPGAEVVAYSVCQTCGWAAYQHPSWAPVRERTNELDEQDRQAAPETPLAERARMFNEEYKPRLIDTGSQNITGYKPQIPEAKDLVNEVKHEEKVFGDFMRDIYFGMAKEYGIKLDPRQVASARTHFEYAFYHLNRAIFQPADPIGDAVTEGLRRE